MAVSTTDTYSGPYAANGVTVAFPFTFKAVSTADVAVIFRASDGSETVADDDLFTVVLASEGGTVTFSTAPLALVGDVFVVSEPAFIQYVEFASGQPFLPSVVNEVNDRDVVRALYLKGKIDRAPQTPIGGGAEGQFPTVLPDGSWGFSSGTGNDPAFRADAASTAPNKGAALVGFKQLGTGAGDRNITAELRETVKISQFYAGGASDSTALQRAYAKLTSDAMGGIIELDVRAYSDPYMIDALAIAELSASGTNPIIIRGKGLATPIQVASACDNFMTFNAAWGGLEDVLILDPNGYCTGAYILTQPTTGAPALERLIANIKIIGPGSISTATAIINNGGQKLRLRGIDVQNVQGLFWNQGGGVDSVLSGFYGLGIKYGIRLDTNGSYGHVENFKAINGTLLCTQANSRGVKITDALHVGFMDVICGQLGSGGIGFEVAPGAGEAAVLTELVNVYLEGSDTGPALKSRGVNREFKMIGGGFGQGGYDASLINCIDMDGASNFVFDGTGANFPLSDCNKVATFANSSGTVTDTNKGWELAVNPSTEVACDIDWGLREDHGLPAARLLTSSYPNGNWSSWTPAVSAGSGAFGALGTSDCAFRRTGKTVDVSIKVPITTNGTAAGSVFVPLPINVKAGKVFILAGRENGVSGKMLQGVATAGGVAIQNYDGSYPGANGAVICVSGTYEVG